MKKIVYLFLVIFLFSGCFLAEQLNEMNAFSKCDFRLKSVNNLKLASVNIQNIKNLSNLNILNAAKIATAYSSGQFPLEFILNVEVRNPNPTNAAMNKLDWILLIDDLEMVSGINNQRVNVSPNGGVSTLPLSIIFDLKKALSGKSGDSIMNFAFNLAGVGNSPTRITLKAKPTIMAGSQPITYPGYISIKKDYTSN